MKISNPQMATRQANNYTRREIEAAETLVSFHRTRSWDLLVLEMHRPLTNCTLSWCLTFPPAVRSTGRQQMAPPPSPLPPPPPFPASRQVPTWPSLPSQRQGDQVYGQATGAALPSSNLGLCTESRFWDKERSTDRVNGQGTWLHPTTMIPTRPWRGTFPPAPPAASSCTTSRARSSCSSEALEAGQPGYSYRCYMCDHTSRNRMRGGADGQSHGQQARCHQRGRVDRARLEDTKVQIAVVRNKGKEGRGIAEKRQGPSTGVEMGGGVGKGKTACRYPPTGCRD
ncbi:hypothetical protein CLCR_11343 [Cladophialophora carrionii]|uniref:Uncharacterized protein n=1 Tax=Cladophialophora carrionii TaxID=86049 RepID=A0A1C1CLY5_9EURO|nr:hypothetical protein CLCR_11343 [Cladophialophora carrionii]